MKGKHSKMNHLSSVTPPRKKFINISYQDKNLQNEILNLAAK